MPICARAHAMNALALALGSLLITSTALAGSDLTGGAGANGHRTLRLHQNELVARTLAWNAGTSLGKTVVALEREDEPTEAKASLGSRLVFAGVTTAVAAGLVGAAAALDDNGWGRAIAIGSGAVGGLVVGAAVAFHGREPNHHEGARVLLALIGPVVGAAAATFATSEPGWSRPVTTTVALVPVVALAIWNVFSE